MQRSLLRNGLYFFVLISVFLATGASAITEFTSPSDLNGDGIIDRRDVFLLLKGFDPHGVTLPTEADRNGDSVADQKDVDLFLFHWRQGRPNPDITIPDPAASGAVEGHVYILNEADEQIPVHDALVSIPDWGLVLKMETDESGHFAFDRVRPGTHLIRAEYEGFFPDRKEIMITVGETTLVDLVLDPSRTDLGVLAGIVRVDSGLADCPDGADCQGAPIPGATVRLIPVRITPPFDYEPYELSDSSEFEHHPGHPTAEQVAQTDERGFYFFPDIPVGLYEVLVLAPGFEPAGQKVEVVADQTTILDFALVATGEGVLFGQATDSLSGSPIQRASIHLFPMVVVPPLLPGEDSTDPSRFSPTTEWNQGPFTAFTDEEGWYEFPNLPGGDYAATMRAPDYEPEKAAVFVTSGTSTRFDFQLKPRTQPFGQVQGTVYGLNDTTVESALPIEGATVYLVIDKEIPEPIPLKAGEEPVADWNPADILNEVDVANVFRQVTTGHDGTYAFERVRPGKYRVLARAADYETGRQEAWVHPAETTIVDFYLRPCPPVTFGSLEGNVFEQAPTAAGILAPVSGALVIAEPWNCVDPHPFRSEGGDSPILTDDRIPSFRALTNEEGFYQFPELPVGRYRVRALAGGFLPAVLHTRIATGETTRVDFYLQPFPLPAGRVVGHVYELVDSASTSEYPPVPIPGVRVTLCPMLGEAGDDLAVDGETGSAASAEDPNLIPGCAAWTAITSRDGYYEFPGIPSGAYRIEADKEGYEPVSGVIEVEPDGITVQDFLLPLDPASGTAWIRGGVYARVEDGLPVAPWPISGAFVLLMPQGVTMPDVYLYVWPTPGIETRITDESGRYGFENVPRGDYVIVVIAMGYEPEVRRFDVQEGDHIEADFFLIPVHSGGPARLSGMITERSNVPTFAPVWVEGALVRLIPNVPEILDVGEADGFPGSFPPEIETYEALTDNQGFYVIEGIKPGEYLIQVEKEGLLPITDYVELPPGADVRKGFVMERPSLMGALSGRVLENGVEGTTGEQPIVGAHVILVSQVIARWDPQKEAGCIFETFSAEDGSYRFENLPVGAYHVTVEARGYAPLFDSIEISPEEEVLHDFFLRLMIPDRPGRVRGLVKGQGPDGEPVLIEPARVSLFSDNGADPLTTLTNGSGEFSIDNVPPGPYLLKVEASGYAPAKRYVEVPSGEEIFEEFILEPNPDNAAFVTGYVTEDTGMLGIWVPIPGAQIALQRSFYTPAQIAFTDEHGAYRIGDLEPGRYLIRAEAEGYEPLEKWIEVPSEGSENVNFRLKKVTVAGTAAFKGSVATLGVADLRVQWPELLPVPGATLKLFRMNHDGETNLEYETSTDENGAFEFPEIVAPAAYEVRIIADLFFPLVDSFEVRPGDALSRVFILIPDHWAGNR